MLISECSLQREKLIVVISLISVINGYSEAPQEYEAEGVSHVEYEQDQMPIKLEVGEGSAKVKRMAVYQQDPSEYESESVGHIFRENNQTPAEDRNWQVKPKPKVKRMSKSGKKVHIYLKNEEGKPHSKPKRHHNNSTTTTTTVLTPAEEKHSHETQTRRTPELTTRSDNIRNIRFTDKDSVAAGSSHSKQSVASSDSVTEASEHHDHQVIKEKIKIKHHHHHHHHNHVKTVVKKEPYPVEKVVHVPVEKIVEKRVPYKVEVPVEKIVEKVNRALLKYV